MRRRLTGILLGFVLGFVLAACGGVPGDVSDLERLCQAQDAATVDEARELFEGPTHQALHDLAEDLQAAELRPVAGDVLEAKQAVEAAFASDPVPEDLQERLTFLIQATGRGLAVLDESALSCGD